MKRLVVHLTMVCALLLIVGLLFSYHRQFAAWLRGEKVFACEPTNFWVKAIREEKACNSNRAVNRLRDGKTKAIPVLIEMLGDSESWKVAVDILIELRVDAVPALIQACKHERTLVRVRALTALGKLGPDADLAVPALVGALNDRRPVVRQQAAMSLAEIGPDSGKVVIALMKALDDPMIASTAAYCLGTFGQKARMAVPALKELAKNKATALGREAEKALNLIEQ